MAATPFQPFGAKKIYQSLVQRRKRKDGQCDIFTQSKYNHALQNFFIRFYDTAGQVHKDRQAMSV